jgi:hypothetical protein
VKSLRTNRVPKNMIVLTQDDLKPEQELSDAELLADAIRSAEEWQQSKNKNKNH